MTGPITTRIPASPEHVHVLRAVVAALAARTGGSVDDLADLRLLVDEAATLLVGAAARPTTLAMTIEPVEGGLRIGLTLEAPGASPPPADGLSWHVLRGLADEVETTSSVEGPAIRILRRQGEG